MTEFINMMDSMLASIAWAKIVSVTIHLNFPHMLPAKKNKTQGSCEDSNNVKSLQYAYQIMKSWKTHIKSNPVSNMEILSVAQMPKKLDFLTSPECSIRYGIFCQLQIRRSVLLLHTSAVQNFMCGDLRSLWPSPCVRWVKVLQYHLPSGWVLHRGNQRRDSKSIWWLGSVRSSQSRSCIFDLISFLLLLMSLWHKHTIPQHLIFFCGVKI